SRVASSITKYIRGSLPIILRAMRDIQPLKFFGGIGMFMFFLPGLIAGGVVAIWDAIGDTETGIIHSLEHPVLLPRPGPVHQLHSDQRRADHVGLPDVRAGTAGRHDGPASTDQRGAALPGAAADLFQSAHATGSAGDARRASARHDGADAARFVDRAQPP